MIKQIISLLLCTLFLNACGQANNNLPKQINIPSTRLFINNIEGFKIASSFVGLEKDDYTGLQVTDLIGGNYYTNTNTFNKESFELKGIKVIDFEKTLINGYPAQLALMQADVNTKTYSVVFGDSTFSVMVMSAFPTNDKKTGENIKKAILSITYDKKMKIDPFSTASFILDENKSIFKFAKSTSNIFFYSINGIKKETYDEDEPILIVTTLPASQNMTTISVSKMLLGSLEKYGFSDKVYICNKEEKVNNYDAYEAVIKGKSKGKEEEVYQLVVFNKDKFVAIQGTAINNFEYNIQEFRKLARTLTFKKK